MDKSNESVKDIFYSQNKKLEIGALRAIFEIEWLKKWKLSHESNESNESDVNDLSSLFDDHDNLRTDLLWKINVAGLPLPFAQSLLTRASIKPKLFDHSELPLNWWRLPNVGIVYRLPENETSTNVQDIFDFNCVELQCFEKNLTIPSFVLHVAPKLHLSDLKKLLFRSVDSSITPDTHHLRLQITIQYSSRTIDLCGKEEFTLGDLTSTAGKFEWDLVDWQSSKLIIENASENCSRHLHGTKLKEKKRNLLLKQLLDLDNEIVNDFGASVPIWWLNKCKEFLTTGDLNQWPGPMPDSVTWSNTKELNLHLEDNFKSVFECDFGEIVLFTDCCAPLSLPYEDTMDSITSNPITNQQQLYDENLEILPPEEFNSSSVKSISITNQLNGDLLCFTSDETLSSVKQVLMENAKISCQDNEEVQLIRIVDNHCEDCSTLLDCSLSQIENLTSLVFTLKLQTKNDPKTATLISLPDQESRLTRPPIAPRPPREKITPPEPSIDSQTYKVIVKELPNDLRFPINTLLSDVFKKICLECVWEAKNGDEIPILHRIFDVNGTEVPRPYMSFLSFPLNKLKKTNNLVFTVKSIRISNHNISLVSEDWVHYSSRLVDLIYGISESQSGRHSMLVGLENLGQSCYMNAVLQCFFQLTPVNKCFDKNSSFVNRILQHRVSEGFINPAWDNSDKRDFIYWFLHLWAFVKAGQFNSYVPNELLKFSNYLNSDFEVQKSNDALIFFAFLLENLHDFTKDFLLDKASAINRRGVGKHRLTLDELEPSTFSKYFSSKLLTKTRCRQCYGATESVQSCRFLSLPIVHSVNLIINFIPQMPWSKYNYPTEVNIKVASHTTFDQILQKLQSIFPHVALNEWRPFLIKKKFGQIIPIQKSIAIENCKKLPKHIYFYQFTEGNLFYFVRLYQYNRIQKNQALKIVPLLIADSQLISQRFSDKSSLTKIDYVINYLNLLKKSIQCQFTNIIDSVTRIEGPERLAENYNLFTLKLLLDIKRFDSKSVNLWKMAKSNCDQLNPEQNWDLNMLLYRFFLPSSSYQDDDYKCEQCQQSGSYQVETILQKPSKIFVIHLRRFSDKMEKINTFVDCPQELDLSRFVTYNETDRQLYRLVGLVCHSGNILSQGHYIAQCLRENKTSAESKWYQFDDNNVYPIKRPNANNAILLFYEKKI